MQCIHYTFYQMAALMNAAVASKCVNVIKTAIKLGSVEGSRDYPT
jgi:hypothetical protein